MIGSKPDQRRAICRDEKEPLFWGFGSVRVLPNIRVHFGLTVLQTLWAADTDGFPVLGTCPIK